MSQVTDRFRALTSGLPREEAALERSLLVAIVAFEWAAIVWAGVAFGLDLVNQPGALGTRPPDPTIALAHPVVGIGLLASALAFTLWSTWRVGRAPRNLMRPGPLAVHGIVALSLVFLDIWVYGGDNLHSQSLGSIWPFTWVFVMAVTVSVRGGFGAGAAVGLVSFAGELRFRSNDYLWSGDAKVGAVGTAVLYALGGAVVGFAARKLREAEREIAFARARDEVARTLHDGVLQTLAVVQRRSPDAELVALAREQESELREFLFGMAPRSATSGSGDHGGGGADLLLRLRDAAALAQRRHGLRVEVVAAADPSDRSAAVVDALGGAVSESLTNAAKHGRATKATVFVDEDDDGRIFVSVKDDGSGFDADAVPEGAGVRGSIRARIAEVGGTVELDAAAGRGTEVRLRI